MANYRGYLTDKNGNKIYNNEDTYAVGDIKLTVTNVSPGIRFGGTWELIAKGMTLIGVDPDDVDFNVPMKTGGEKTHKLTSRESGVAPHKHSIQPYDGVGAYGVGEHTGHICQNGSVAFNTYYADYNTAQDAELAHNNVPPYFTCYIWLRIA